MFWWCRVIDVIFVDVIERGSVVEPTSVTVAVLLLLLLLLLGGVGAGVETGVRWWWCGAEDVTTLTGLIFRFRN